MTLSWIREGRKEGVSIGERKSILRQISRRTTVTPEIRERIRKMPLKQLREIGDALLDPAAPLLDLIFAQPTATPEQITP